jgi:outer membrane biosynthesis protein TonB
MKRATWLKAAGAFLLGMASLAVAKEPKSVVILMLWDISVDAEGHITRLSTKSDRLVEVQDRIEQAIRSWQFNPGKVDGVPVASDSTLSVELTATLESDGKYAVRVTDAHAGVGVAVMKQPQYPHVSLVSRRQGYVVLKVTYGTDGKVLDVVPADDAPKVDSPFVNASIMAMRQWVFAPEVIGGHPRAGWALVPICFAIADKHMRAPDCSWQPEKGPKVSGDGIVALDAEVTLKSDVAGRAL